MNREFDRFVGRNVRALRKENNLSQEELAARLQVLGCDMTRSAVAKVEVGQRHIYSDEIYLLRKIFRCGYERFFEKNGEEDF